MAEERQERGGGVGADDRQAALAEARFRQETEDRGERKQKEIAERRKKEALKATVTRAMRADARHRRFGTPRQQSPAKRVAQLSEAFFGGAVEVIRHSLEEGDLRAALFVAGRHMDAVGACVSTPVELPEDASPSDAAMAVLRKMLAGEIPVAMGERMLRSIEHAANLQLGDEIADLRKMIADMGGDAKVIEGERLSPAWLRLQQAGPQPMGPHPDAKANGHANGHMNGGSAPEDDRD